MLAPQLLQGLRELALELPLPPIVDLHQPGLMAPLGLPQLLGAGQGTLCHLREGTQHTQWGLSQVIPAPLQHTTAHLTVNVLLEFKLFLQRLQPVLSIHAAQHLILQLLLGFTQGTFQLAGN